VITAEKVRTICRRCQIAISGLLEGVGFRACYNASAQSSTAGFRKSKVLGKLEESVPIEMTDKSLRVKLVIVTLLEHNLNQRISHFRSFNSTRKVNIEESFGSSTHRPDIALPTVRQLGFFIIAISLKFYLPPFV